MSIFDMLLSNAMMGESGGGGGGGSSDFSTAEVTITANAPLITGAIISSFGDFSDSSMATSGEDTFTVILYKGCAYINFGTPSTEGNVTASGNIELDIDDGEVWGAYVTGNGTITIS